LQASSHLLGAAVMLGTVGTLAFDGASQAAPAPSSHILIVDKQAIMNGSKLGEDIRRQIMAYENDVQTQLGPESQALQKEGQALQQQAPNLPPAVRDKKIAAFQAKEDAFKQKVQAKQKLIQGGEFVSRKRYLAEVGAVIHAVMTERGADVVLEKSSVADSMNGADITPTVIQRLDTKISSLKVPLVPPPADMNPIPH
jgi:Skp family chaperone for outer membrane proteins